MLANIQKQHLVSCNMLYIYIFVWCCVKTGTKMNSCGTKHQTLVKELLVGNIFASPTPGRYRFSTFCLDNQWHYFYGGFLLHDVAWLLLEHDWRNFWIHTCHRILCSNTWIIKCHNVRRSEYRNHASMTTTEKGNKVTAGPGVPPLSMLEASHGNSFEAWQTPRKHSGTKDQSISSRRLKLWFCCWICV